MAYKNTAELKWKVGTLGVITAAAFLVANTLGAFDGGTSVNPAPDRDGPPSPPGNSAPGEVKLDCIGIRGIRGDDRNLHVRPEIVGPLPPDSTITYEARYGNRLSEPIVGRDRTSHHPPRARRGVTA